MANANLVDGPHRQVDYLQVIGRQGPRRIARWIDALRQ
jgi:hypothetical protein